MHHSLIHEPFRNCSFCLIFNRSCANLLITLETKRFIDQIFCEQRNRFKTPHKIATKTEIIKNINAKVGIVELRKTDVDKNVSENKIKEIKKFIMLLENHPEELQEL